jgi:outer membrane protein assembly factor BamB
MKWIALNLLPAVLAIAGVGSICLWLSDAMSYSVDVREPAGRPAESAPARGRGVPAGKLITGDGVAADMPQSACWPWFRGSDLSAISGEEVKLAREFPSGGPKVVWTTPVGEGYAAPAIRGGRAYLIDYDHAARSDAIRCLSMKDGREIWRYSYPVDIKVNHGISRTVPAVTESLVVTIGPMCHVVCLDAASGELRWSLDMVGQYGAKVPEWYAGQCPLVDGQRLILAPAGPEALMVAMDLPTGRELWRCPNPMGWKMTHSSVAPMEVAGRRMYVYCGSGGVAGVSADDGALLWQTDAWKINTATVPTPVPLGQGRVLLSGGYGAGSMVLGVEVSSGAFTAGPILRLTPKQFGSEQQTPIVLDGHIYGVLPRDAGSLSCQMVCLDAQGKQLWASGPGARFGIGPYMMADGMLLAMDDFGVLTLAEASPRGFRVLARAEVFANGREAWGPMAVAGGCLLVRDLTRLACIDMRAAD